MARVRTDAEPAIEEGVAEEVYSTVHVHAANTLNQIRFLQARSNPQALGF